MTMADLTIGVVVPANPVVDVLALPGPPGPPGPAGEPGPQGPPGEAAAPAGTGFVKVTNGVFDTPSTAISTDEINSATSLYLTAFTPGGTINFAASGEYRLSLTGGALTPLADNAYDFGGSQRWRAGYFGTSISVGTNPAQTGAIRLANDQAIVARNAGNTADTPLLSLRNDNYISLGGFTDTTLINGNLQTQGNIWANGPIAAATSVAVGTNPATTGEIRLPNAGAIMGKRTDSGNVRMLKVETDNSLNFGENSPYTKITNPLVANVDVTTPIVNVGTSVAVGTNPAQTGAIRLANNGAIWARNPANNGDVAVMNVVAGTDTVAFQNQSVNINVQGTIYPSSDGVPDLGWSGGRFRNLYLSGSVVGPVGTALYFEDNGSGKTRLMVRFATGAPVQIAIEP